MIEFWTFLCLITEKISLIFSLLDKTLMILFIYSLLVHNFHKSILLIWREQWKCCMNGEKCLIERGSQSLYHCWTMVLLKFPLFDHFLFFIQNSSFKDRWAVLKRKEFDSWQIEGSQCEVNGSWKMLIAIRRWRDHKER